MHIPKCKTTDLSILTFEDALIGNEIKTYDPERWIYVPDFYSEYRFILGTKGANPLICIGINPSTAEPDHLDNTLLSVQRIAAFNGFDSFIMFNVYAQRATDPDHMEEQFNPFLHDENMKAFRYILESSSSCPSIWAAWGTIIKKRPYLFHCVRDMIKIASEYCARWYTVGARSKVGGHPHHPLYLKKESYLDLFCADEYIKEYIN